MSAQAILRIGATVATLYASLGEEAIIHGINESEVTHVITSQDQLYKLAKVIQRIANVKCIIYFEGVKPVTAHFEAFVRLVPFEQLVADGKAAPETLGVQPNEHDVAVILYTSGSTGNPKGVLLTHKNFMTAVSSALTVTDEKYIGYVEDHIFMAFLPLAHSLEFFAEILMFSMGARIGYGTPYTLTDNGTAVRKGDKGDLTLLRPTILPTVPLILERIRKTIDAFVKKKGPFAKELFEFIINYKTFWERRGYKTPIINKLLCSRIQSQVGGRLQMMIVGGAPLSPDTQKIMKSSLNVHMLQVKCLVDVCYWTILILI